MKHIIHDFVLAKYGLRYGIYTAKDIFMSFFYRLIPNKYKKYPLYSMARLKKKFFFSSTGIFNFNGILIPDLPQKYLKGLGTIYIDEFHIHCHFNDDYSTINLDEYDMMAEGPYCYPFDNNGNILIEEDDIVIDAGAWIGDFSAYAVSKGAKKAYAFEIDSENLIQLRKTANLNKGVFVIEAAVGESDRLVYITGESNGAFVNEEVKGQATQSQSKWFHWIVSL